MKVLKKYKTNEIIKFNDSNSLRKINSGTVDFFLIEDTQNKQKGHRRYVFTLGEDCYFPTYETQYENEDFCLIGIAKSDVEISEQKKFDISICDAAMNTLEKCLPDSEKNHKRILKITSLSTLEMDPDECLINNTDTGVWIAATEGEVCINDYDVLNILPQTGFLPLPPNGFITAKTYCLLKACTSEELISYSKSIDSVQESILTSIQISLNIILASTMKKETLEHERIRDRSKNNEVELDASLRDLSKLFGEKTHSSVMTDDLHSALIPICKELGVNLNVPTNGSEKLDHILEATGLRSRGVVLKDNWWKFNCGVLLAWKEENSVPVALIPSGHGYKMYAPGESSVNITGTIASTLKSNAVSMYVPLPAHSLSISDIFKYVLNCIKLYDVIIYLCVGIGVSILSLAIPAITEELFGVIVPRQDTSGLISITFFLVATVVVSAILKISQHISHLLFETKSGAPLQAAVWDRLYHLPITFFKKYGTSELLKRASGVEAMQKLLSGTCIQGVLGIVALISGFVLMMKYNVKLALVLFGCNLVVMIPLIKICFSIGFAEHAIADEEAKSTGVLLQIIQGINKFKTTCTEIKAFSLWEKAFSKLLRITYKRDKRESVVLSISNIIPPSFLLLLYILYMTELFGSMSMGSFLAFSAAFAEVSEILVEFCHVAIELGEVKACYHHLEPILKECPEGFSAASNCEDIKGNIEIKDVSFRYSQELPAILRGLSMSIPEGSFIAITGESGCGKSTLVQLLLGFEKPEAGLISYDGQDISLIDCRLIRKQMGVVLQNGRIFADDILTNITCRSTELTVDDAWLAAETAEIADDINKMPMGMYTVLGEKGSILSDGQKQRLLIARALANRPKVLIFDEATSALDNKTQAKITANIRGLNCTRIVVAQRLNSIRHADKIYYLENGAIAESGSYEELMKKKGKFFEMASCQLS